MNNILLPKIAFKNIVADESRIKTAYARIFEIARRNISARKITSKPEVYPIASPKIEESEEMALLKLNTPKTYLQSTSETLSNFSMVDSLKVPNSQDHPASSSIISPDNKRIDKHMTYKYTEVQHGSKIYDDRGSGQKVTS